MLPNGPPPTYLPTSQVYLKHRLHTGDRSSHHSTQQTLITRISHVPNLITLLLYNTQQRNHLYHRTRVQNRRQTRRMTGRVCRRPRSLMFPTSTLSPWTQLRLPRPKNSHLNLLLSLMLCVMVSPMKCQPLLRSCIKPRHSNFGSRGGLYLACLATATRTTYLLWMSRTAHSKARTTQHPLSERSPRVQIAARYRRCHRLPPQRLHRWIPRR